MKVMQAHKGSNTMTRRNRLALVISLVSLLACVHFAPVSACELNGAETCERPIAGYAEQSESAMNIVGVIAAPATSDDSINIARQDGRFLSREG